MKLIGLQAKLNRMRLAGFTIGEDCYNELIEWGKLRNALSHCPPEWYGYVTLNEDDIKEYIALLKKVIAAWNKEMISIYP